MFNILQHILMMKSKIVAFEFILIQMHILNKYGLSLKPSAFFALGFSSFSHRLSSDEGFQDQKIHQVYIWCIASILIKALYLFLRHVGSSKASIDGYGTGNLSLSASHFLKKTYFFGMLWYLCKSRSMVYFNGENVKEEMVREPTCACILLSSLSWAWTILAFLLGSKHHTH